eukprot:scaffold43640_cov33-Tisochrysis_lutea.AAC.3
MNVSFSRFHQGAPLSPRRSRFRLSSEMAPKKSGKAKDSKDGGSKQKSSWTPFVPSEDPIIQRGPPQQWIIVRVCSITWSVMDFSLRMLSEKPVLDIVSHIKERHGGSVNAPELSIYKEEVHPRNLLSDLWLQLGDLLPESRDESEMAKLTFYYDFKPIATDCAIALRAPHNLKVETLLAGEKAAAAKSAAGQARRSMDGAAARQSIDTHVGGRRTSIRGREEAVQGSSRHSISYLSTRSSTLTPLKR